MLPSTWANNPPAQVVSTNPVCHRSQTSTYRLMSGSSAQIGLPRRVCMIPSPLIGGILLVTETDCAPPDTSLIDWDRCDSNVGF